MRNLTVAVPEELVKRAKVVAARRETSISALVTQFLRDLARTEDDEYEQARLRSLQILKRGFNMGSQGKATWTRDELHDRS